MLKPLGDMATSMVRDHRGLPTTCDVMMTLTSEFRLPIRTSVHPFIAESDG
jgi:hypothetical protein